MNNKHILVAEDEDHTRVTLSILLRKAGYKVTAVKDGQEALKKIAELKESCQSADLLLTDIQMPGISGMELIDELKKLNIDMPVLVITGYGDEDMVAALMHRGCGYLDKPFTPQGMLDRVALILGLKIED